MFKKLGESFTFTEKDILPAKVALSDDKITKRFIKLAKKIKKVAPKADGFNFFVAAIMHASEFALLDQETKKPLLNKEGKPVRGWFEQIKNANGEDSIKWVSPDGIKPYTNGNRDSFPHDQLKLHAKKWIGKALCRDHVSDSVEGVRGIIVDVHYDEPTFTVYALMAIDNKNYPELADKVVRGYANSVSMGTGVGRSACSECGNIARTERDYCNCVRTRSNYAEFNLDLSPIEVSLVTNGADPLAKVKKIVASLNQYADQKEQQIAKLTADRCVNPAHLQDLTDSLTAMQKQVMALMRPPTKKIAKNEDLGELVAAYKALNEAGETEEATLVLEKIKDLVGTTKEEEVPTEPLPATNSRVEIPEDDGRSADYLEPTWLDRTQDIALNPANKIASQEGGKEGTIYAELDLLRSKLSQLESKLNNLKSNTEDDMNSARLKARALARRAYFQGTEEPTPGKTKYTPDPLQEKVRETEDKHMVGQNMETGSDGLYPGDEEKKKKLLRAELEERKMRRRAYFQGTEEPTPGKTKYTPDPLQEKVRETEDRHMVNPTDFGDLEGMVPGDKEVKEKLLRAKLSTNFTRVANKETGELKKDACYWTFKAGGKPILKVTAGEAYEDEVNDYFDFFTSKAWPKKVAKAIREEGFENVVKLFKSAQEPGLEDLGLGGMDAGLGAAPAPAPATTPAPAPEAAAPAEGKPEVEVEKNELQTQVEKALADMEAAIDSVRNAIAGGGSGELVDINVSVEQPEEKASAPVDQALASRKDLLKVEALLDMSADELAEASEALDNMDKLAADKQSDLLKAVRAALADGKQILALAKKKDDKKKKEEEKEDEECEEEEEECEEEEEEKEDKKEKKDKKDKKSKAELDALLTARANKRAKLVAEAMDEECDECGDMEMDAVDEAAKQVANKAVEEALKSMQMADDEWEFEGEEEDLSVPEDFFGDEEQEKKFHEMMEKREKEHAELPDWTPMSDREDEEFVDGEEDFAEDVGLEMLEARKDNRNALLAKAKAALDNMEKVALDKKDVDELFFQAHPKPGPEMEELDGKNPESKVETIMEVQDKMMAAVHAKPEVKQAAEKLQQLVSEGTLDEGKIKQLVSMGKVDQAAAEYWKKYLSQAPEGGSEFADKLVSDFHQEKKAADMSKYKAMVRRAYQVGLDAQSVGLVDPGQAALDKYVDNLMKFDDEAFESNKRVIAGYKKKVAAAQIPRVGLNGSSKPIVATASEENPGQESLYDQLVKLF